MAKINVSSTNNQATHNIFDDLERYLEFCREYGYTYDESKIYDTSKHVTRQFLKYVSGKPAKNMWEADAKAMEAKGY